MKIIIVHASTPGARSYFRCALDRIVDFCRKYESEADPELMYSEVCRNFFLENPSMVVFVGLNERGAIVAHLLAAIEEYFGNRRVTVLQYWKDHGESIGLDQKAEVLEAVAQWGQRCGATEMKIYARNEQVAQIFEKYGFKRDKKVIMNAPLESFTAKEEGADGGQ